MGRSGGILVGLVAFAAIVGIWVGSAYESGAQTDGAVEIQPTLYYADGSPEDFKSITMSDDGAHGDGEARDGVYGAQIPSYPAGTLVHYMFTYQIAPPAPDVTPPPDVVEDPLVGRIVINELMASNTTAVQDPQEEYDDWVELLNVSEEVVDLSGMYLTDAEDNPKKWTFPEGTTLAPGAYLIVWADEDGGDEPGLHANFRLSSLGEIVLLVDADARGNTQLDSVAFGKMDTDVSFGRNPDGAGTLLVLPVPTPGAANISVRLNTDFDGDGAVGFSDFLQFARQFGRQRGDEGFDPKYDLDGNGAVGFSDFVLFAQNFAAPASRDESDVGFQRRMSSLWR